MKGDVKGKIWIKELFNSMQTSKYWCFGYPVNNGEDKNKSRHP